MPAVALGDPPPQNRRRTDIYVFQVKIKNENILDIEDFPQVKKCSLRVRVNGGSSYDLYTLFYAFWVNIFFWGGGMAA